MSGGSDFRKGYVFIVLKAEIEIQFFNLIVKHIFNTVIIC